jgi:preprotein translocase subunit SecF
MFAMLIGVVAGTITSLFVGAPVAYMILDRSEKKLKV